MTVLLAVLAVGAGSVAFRLLPLLGARLTPPAATRLAGRAGLFLAFRGRSVLLSVAVGVTSYLLLPAATAALS